MLGASERIGWEDFWFRKSGKASWKRCYFSYIVKSGWDCGCWKGAQRPLQVAGMAEVLRGRRQACWSKAHCIARALSKGTESAPTLEGLADPLRCLHLIGGRGGASGALWAGELRDDTLLGRGSWQPWVAWIGNAGDLRLGRLVGSFGDLRERGRKGKDGRMGTGQWLVLNK